MPIQDVFMVGFETRRLIDWLETQGVSFSWSKGFVMVHIPNQPEITFSFPNEFLTFMRGYCAGAGTNYNKVVYRLEG